MSEEDEKKRDEYAKQHYIISNFMVRLYNQSILTGWVTDKRVLNWLWERWRLFYFRCSSVAHFSC